MKFFIVAALLVAAAAGQTTMDLYKLNKEQMLLNKYERPIERELLLKKLGYPMEKTFTYGDNVDTLFQDEIMTKNVVLRLEEVMEHPLFREYINLPLFRQFWTYPMFQKYVTSVYFQRFWHIPAFKTYFYNPVLFYKYIYPIVTLFKTEFTMPTTTFGDELIKDEIVNKNVFPVVTGYERDLLKDNLFVPTIYNQDLKFKDELLVKNLMTKIYTNLYNIPEELVMNKFLTQDKIFDPITLNKDVLLKKYLLNKMVKDVVPEEYLLREKMMKMNPVTRMLYGFNKLPVYNKFETVDTVDKMMFNTMFKKDLVKDEIKKELIKDEIKKEFIKEQIKKDLIKKDLVEEVLPFAIKKDLIKDEILPFTMQKELINDEFLPYTLKKEMLLKNKILNNKIFNDKIFNDMEIDTTFETPMTKIVDFTTPMMGVKTFDKKVFPETMIKY